MTKPERRTILVLAYSISPSRGSEYAVGWNYVTHMARDHDLIVLYGLAGDHMGDIEEIAGITSDQFGGRVTFVPVMPDHRARIANHLNRTGRVPFSFYIAYRYWHLTALETARRIVAERRIDVVHYLCPIGFREPGYLWKLGLPYIWGPVGGIALRPARAFFGLSWRAGLLTAARNLANRAQFIFSRRVARGIRAADVLLAATSENVDAIRETYGCDAIMIPENAVMAVAENHAISASSEPLQLIWAGRVVIQKALDILIEALATIPDTDWRLTVVGDGPRREMLEALAIERGIADRITWTGQIDRDAVTRLFSMADVHILSSFAEAHSTVLWEAMAEGVPTIAIDHCGMRDSIEADSGIKIPLADIPTMIHGFAAAIRRLTSDRALVAQLSTAALACATRNDWNRRTTFWKTMYDRAIAIHGARETGQ